MCIPQTTKVSLIFTNICYSELAGAAGLTVVGSTYQRVLKPSIEYYIGQGKTKEISKTLSKLKCTCVIFDTGMSFISYFIIAMFTIHALMRYIQTILYYTIYT